jgi:hypothetical protein
MVTFFFATLVIKAASDGNNYVFYTAGGERVKRVCITDLIQITAQHVHLFPFNTLRKPDPH